MKIFLLPVFCLLAIFTTPALAQNFPDPNKLDPKYSGNIDPNKLQALLSFESRIVANAIHFVSTDGKQATLDVFEPDAAGKWVLIKTVQVGYGTTLGSCGQFECGKYARKRVVVSGAGRAAVGVLFDAHY